MKRHNFRNLKIYQRSVAFAVEIYRITRRFPKEEVYGLTSQIRRAVISISLNRFTGSNSPLLAANDSNEHGFNTPLLAAG
jgi:hypothetical protein